ncbi:hypothetical protein V4V36_24620 [Paenibacillus lautus]|nr:hypothetical protein [Paenibacillus lautus]
MVVLPSKHAPTHAPFAQGAVRTMYKISIPERQQSEAELTPDGH